MKTIARGSLDKFYTTALQEVELALGNSYCPCSGLCVAAGWLLADGTVITGTNYESASYGLTLCAERSALARAQAEGIIQHGTGMIIASAWKAGDKKGSPLTPCGACRQWLAELSQRLDSDFPVYSFWKNIEMGIAMNARELLPDSFDIKNLSSG